MKMPIYSVLLTVWSLSGATAVLAADAEKGAYLANTCMGCHAVMPLEELEEIA